MASFRLFWRSGRDSNPRAAFDDNTISSRARYDLFDTTANIQFCDEQHYLLEQKNCPCQEVIPAKLRFFAQAGGRRAKSPSTACRDPSVQHGCDSHQRRVQCISHPLHGLAHNGFSGLRVGARRHIHRRAGYHADADAPQKCGHVHFYLTPFPYSTSISRRREKNTRCFLPNRPKARYNNI